MTTINFSGVTSRPLVRKWSPQQTVFINWCDTGEGSCVLVAGAGCGKSTTLEAGARKLTARGKRVAVVAFNRKIAREMKRRLQDDRNVWVGTVHSFGNRALKQGLPDLAKVDPNEHKVGDLFDQYLLTVLPEEKEAVTLSKATIVKLVSLAKQRAVIGAEIDDRAEWLEIIEHFGLLENGREKLLLTEIELARHARKILLMSNQRRDVYDYDDMIYLPLQLGLSFPKFDVVMVDEAQDTNPARRLVVRRMMKAGARVVAVGDPKQAIYGFTGADNDALDQVKREFRAITLPLTTTYRCPKKVVEFASQWVGDHLQAHESAPEGVVGEETWASFIALAKRDVEDRTNILPNTAILCRLNAPLVRAAFNLIRERVPCKIEGREIAEGLKKLANKWAIKDLDDLVRKLDVYLEAETEKLTKKKQEMKLATLTDQVETLKVIIDQCQLEGKRKVNDVIRYLDDLFAEEVSGMLTLCSIHRAKGLEWDNVYWLDRMTTCPSKWARKDWEREQETNLCYVAATRAKHALYDLASPPKDGTVNPYAGVLDRVAQQGSRLGRKQEPGKRRRSSEPKASGELIEKARQGLSDDDKDTLKLSDDEKRAKRNADKARRARERRARAKAQ